MSVYSGSISLFVRVVSTYLFLSIVCLPVAEGDSITDLFLKNIKDVSVQKTEYKPKPIPAGKDALTWKEYNRQYNLWLAKRNISNYEKYGSHSPDWDEKFKSFINDVFQNSNGSEGCKNNEEIYALGQDLEKLGCDDPYFYFLYGNYAKIINGVKEGLPLFDKSLRLQEEKQYPPFSLFLAARNLQTAYLDNKEKKKAEVTGRKKMLYLAEAASDEIFRNGHQRYFIRKFINVFPSGGCGKVPEYFDVFMKELEAGSDVDPWIKLVVYGYYHTHKGWEARGSGYASTVTDDGFKIFREELKKASEALSSAHEMHPEYPEAAAKMITIAMASSCGSGDERMWFDRAVAAQMDYGSAYNHFLWALRPRWGGSHRAMYELGLECLDTKRFDTYVPIYFRRALKDISGELDDWRDAYRAPGVYEKNKIFFAGMLAEPSRADAKICWTSQLGMAAWLTGHFDDSKKIFEELGDKLEDHVFTDFKCEKQFAVSETLLMTSPFKEVFSGAERLYERGQSMEALPLYEEVLQGLKADDCRSLINDRLAVLRLKGEFMTGEWIDFMPDKSMAGWQIIGGDWSVQDGENELKGVTTGKKTSIKCLSKMVLSDDFEIRGEVDAKYRGSVHLGYANDKFLTLRIDKYKKEVSLKRRYSKAVDEKKRSAELLPCNRFLITVKNNRVSASVNDKVFFSDEAITDHWWNPDTGRVGFGSYFGKSKGYVLKYRNLQIRKMIEAKE